MTYPRSRCGTDGPSQSAKHASEGFRLFETPSPSQCSPGITSIDGARHQPTPFLLPGLTAQVKRAMLPSGSRITLVCLAFRSRVARFFLPASEEGKRATLPTGIRSRQRRLGYPPRVALFLLASVWLSLRNLSLSAVVSQALRTNTAAGRAFFIPTSKPVAAREALP